MFVYGKLQFICIRTTYVCTSEIGAPYGVLKLFMHDDVAYNYIMKSITLTKQGSSMPGNMFPQQTGNWNLLALILVSIIEKIPEVIPYESMRMMETRKMYTA